MAKANPSIGEHIQSYFGGRLEHIPCGVSGGYFTIRDVQRLPDLEEIELMVSEYYEERGYSFVDVRSLPIHIGSELFFSASLNSNHLLSVSVTPYSHSRKLTVEISPYDKKLFESSSH